jgi:uncharacterized damage-inducible protein DinB
MALYSALTERLKNQHGALGHIISNINATRLNFHPAPGKWSIHDNIAHLARYQQYFFGRMHTILENDSPTFERYNADLDPEFEAWRKRGTTGLLETLNADRKPLFDLLSTLTDDKLNRVGIHKKFGELTIAQWVEFFVLHEAHHLFTIFRLATDVDIIV